MVTNASVRKLTDDDIRFVLALCVQAGNLAIEMREGASIETKSHPEDFVTSADKAISSLLIGALTERFREDVVQSEEALWVQTMNQRSWLIDPIDGTKYFLDGSGNYAVMIGLLQNGKPVFGCFYMPALKLALLGGSDYGLFEYDANVNALVKVATRMEALDTTKTVKVLVSKNDLLANPWVNHIPGIEIVRATSIGIDVLKLLRGEADIFVHIRPTLMQWDTAATAAVAQSLQLDVGTEESDHLDYGFESPTHLSCVVIGKKGALAWWRELFAGHVVI